MDFYTLLTNNGKGSITRSYAMSPPLHLTTFAVGDGGDGYYDPDITQTSLINETYRGNISKIYVDTDYENRLIVECAIPSDSGGYYIREVGIFDSNKNLFAIGRLPESYKPIEEEGSTRDFYIKVVLEVENLEDRQLIIDSNVSIVSFDYLENNHNKDVNAHYRLIDADKLLKDLIEHFSSKTLSIENCPEDELGQGYEYLVQILSNQFCIPLF